MKVGVIETCISVVLRLSLHSLGVGFSLRRQSLRLELYSLGLDLEKPVLN